MPTYKVEITIKAEDNLAAQNALENLYYGCDQFDVEVLDGSVEEVEA